MCIETNNAIVFCVLNAKYIHASPAPWCLAAGVKKYSPEFYNKIEIVEATINRNMEEVLNEILLKEPEVLGFSCYLWNIKETLNIALAVKDVLPETVIVLGGPEVSYCAKVVLENNIKIDYILSGEGEQTVPEFLTALYALKKDGKFSLIPAERVGGLCGRDKNGNIYEAEPFVGECDPPSSVSSGYDKALKGRIAYFETSRGCPYSCAFCLSGRCGKPRYFDLEQCFNELISLVESGVKTVKFVDRTFNANPIHANKILSFILKNHGESIPSDVCFHFEIAGDILKEDTMNLFSKMPQGAVQLEIGMQSFCEKTLESVCRKTNTEILKKNITRLVEMENMHIHIDLIAGLPFEDITTFSKSFNTAFSLNAQMLQLGFLKLLHGSKMREEPENYPCEFDKSPPYQVISTPYMSRDDFKQLHNVEQALERCYNSGRLRLTIDYILSASGKDPFEFFSILGNAAQDKISPNISFNDYMEFFQNFCLTIPNIDSKKLRDFLLRDRLSTNPDRISKCLYIKDNNLGKITKILAKNPQTAPKSGIRRNIAILYSAKTVCWVDYADKEKNLVTKGWKLKEISIENLLV